MPRKKTKALKKPKRRKASDPFEYCLDRFGDVVGRAIFGFLFHNLAKTKLMFIWLTELRSVATEFAFFAPPMRRVLNLEIPASYPSQWRFRPDAPAEGGCSLDFVVSNFKVEGQPQRNSPLKQRWGAHMILLHEITTNSLFHFVVANKSGVRPNPNHVWFALEKSKRFLHRELKFEPKAKYRVAFFGLAPAFGKFQDEFEDENVKFEVSSYRKALEIKVSEWEVSKLKVQHTEKVAKVIANNSRHLMTQFAAMSKDFSKRMALVHSSMDEPLPPRWVSINKL